VVRPDRAPCGARAALSWDCDALRGRVSSRCDGHGFPSARTAFLRPPGNCGTGFATDCSARHPPCAFRFPSEVHRSTPAPSRTPEGILVRRCFLPWAFVPHDTCRSGGPSPRGVRPHGEPREVWVPRATMTTTPSEVPCGPPSVHGLCPSRRSPRTGRTPSRESLPSCRWPRRFASPLKERADAVGFRASIPVASSFCPPRPCERDASMPSWVSSLQSVLPLRPCERFVFAPGPSSRVGQERRPDPPASRGVAERRDRLAPLGAAGSPGIPHLTTVAAS